MFTLTENARKELEAFFQDKDKSAVRIYATSGGCSGPRLALALDERSSTDTLFQSGGFDFCIDNSLLELIEGVTVDAGYMGFVVEGTKPLATGGGCSSCGGGCGGCGA